MFTTLTSQMSATRKIYRAKFSRCVILFNRKARGEKIGVVTCKLYLNRYVSIFTPTPLKNRSLPT